MEMLRGIFRMLFGWGIVFATVATLRGDKYSLIFIAIGGFLIGLGANGWSD